MLDCWNTTPSARPSFAHIKAKFRDYDKSTYENIMGMPMYVNLATLGQGPAEAMSTDGSTSNGTVTLAAVHSSGVPTAHYARDPARDQPRQPSVLEDAV